ncbi:MAG: Holliday junction resolvase RuvX [Erysipelotrichaceae bacterium]|nr:Holliday junction resolvase RuvX [Erysipelotrichaceae bacterium]
MRILGLDLGSKTLGIAISDTNEKLATMRETYRFPSEEYDYAVDKIIEYIDEYQLKEIALGLPRHMNGDLGIRGELSITFKEIIEKERPGVVVELIDERLTSVQAEKMMISLDTSRKKRKQQVDSMAAMEILQSYLDKKRNLNNG